MGKGAFGSVVKLFDLTNYGFAAKKRILKEPGKELYFNNAVMTEINILLKILKSQNKKLMKVYNISYIPEKEASFIMECGHGDFLTYMEFRKILGVPFSQKEI